MNFVLARIKKIDEESSEVRTFHLLPIDTPKPVYQPGHFFILRLIGEDGKPIQRSYSAASHPDEPELSFCIKLKGVFTHLLWKLKEGDGIEIDGPYGIFLLRREDTERVFIGGGVGISALRSHILQTLKEGKPCWLFHSARTGDALTYCSQMEQCAKEQASFSCHFSITGPDKPEDWGGLAQRIDVPLLLNALGSLEGKTFYLCGSKEMCAELSSALLANNVPKELIKKDEWV